MKTIIAGLDIGNGYIKGAFIDKDGAKEKIDIPSCVAGIVKPPSLPDVATDEYISDIFNRMICQFNTPIVRDTRYFALANAALTSNRSLIEFDIADNRSKAEQDLSAILVLSSIAGAALRNYWDEYHALPTDVLNINTQVALALPIDEYMKYRDMFAGKFEKYEHEVTICNFDTLVHIRIKFIKPTVLPEGLSAQFAIVSKGEEFIQALLDDVRSHDANALQDITAKDVIECSNTCGIDIGEGTVNLPVITDGRFNSIASRTIQKGYGTILEQSIPRILESNMPYNTRKALADFMQKPETAMNRRKKATALDIIESEMEDLVEEITREISRILSSGSVDMIYVYGGGANPMKNALYNRLIEKANSYSGGDPFPILYLDSTYARNLNREGLLSVAMQDYQRNVAEGVIVEA